MLTAVLLGLLAQGAKERYQQKIGEMSDYFWKERLRLAEWAKSSGLNREARGLLEFMVKNIQGTHPYKTRADTLLWGPWKRQPNSATTAKQKEYLRRLESYYRATADRCFEAYRIAKAASMKEETVTALQKTIEFYHDHEGARKERGEEKVDGFGWIAKADAEFVRASCFDADSRSVEDLEKSDGEHETWASAWVVRSKHYVLRTDLPVRRALAALELLEKLHAVLLEWCEGSFTEPPERMGVYFFRRLADLEAERAKLPNTPAAVAFYHALTNVVYVRSFDSARENGGGVGRSDQEFLLHEATHQLLDRGAEQRVVSIFQQSNQRLDAVDNYWIVEGAATWFSTLRFEGGEAKLGSDAWRIGAVRGLATQGKLPTLRSFLELSYDEFLKGSHANYAISYALTAFLVEKYKKPFVTFLREYYLGNGSLPSFEKTVSGIDKLDREFRVWLGEK